VLTGLNLIKLTGFYQILIFVKSNMKSFRARQAWGHVFSMHTLDKDIYYFLWKTTMEMGSWKCKDKILLFIYSIFLLFLGDISMFLFNKERKKRYWSSEWMMKHSGQREIKIQEMLSKITIWPSDSSSYCIKSWGANSARN